MTALTPPVHTPSLQGERSSNRRVAIFGSTGSVGQTALGAISQLQRLEVHGLFAHSSVDTFVEQVLTWQPAFAGLSDRAANALAREKLGSQFRGEWLSSEEEMVDYAAKGDYHTQLAAVVGIEGFQTSYPAFAHGKTVALANKESLVVGGQFFAELPQDKRGVIIPVDSEHSSLFRLLHLLSPSSVRKLGLTASGGPFRGRTKEELSAVTREEALDHPTWKMGPRITLDSATLMNKAFELIEATWLFGYQSKDILVRIHPQSVVHAFVECSDGTLLSHMSPPNMLHPVVYALEYPTPPPKLEDSFQNGSIEFEICDEERYQALALARQVADAGFGEALRFYTANEIAARRFLDSAIPFNKIVEFVDYALQIGKFSEACLPAQLLGTIEEERRQIGEVFSTFVGKKLQ
ncbi:MAG: 1-deoxy-D-xylulose-5-phosphate reductoisomerase [Bdellovibrionales bacterium]|nr:1-deoxy-D-xylulose-5-phosphate reductoisomerase [Bdellovibrionales bacterium]